MPQSVKNLWILIFSVSIESLLSFAGEEGGEPREKSLSLRFFVFYVVDGNEGGGADLLAVA